MSNEDEKDVKIVEAEAISPSETTRGNRKGGNKHFKKRQQNQSHQHGGGGKNKYSSYTSKTEELKHDTFTLGSNMGKKWMTSREAFINYTGRTYGGSVKASLHKLEKTILHINQPKQHTAEEYAKLNQMEIDMWKMDYKEFKEETSRILKNLVKLYDVLWDQCEPALKNKLKAQPQYGKIMEESNVIDLLKLIDYVCSANDGAKYYHLQSFYALKKLMNFRQRDEQDIADYFKEFEMLLRIAEQSGTNFATPERCEAVAMETYKTNYRMLTKGQQESTKERAREQFIATIFMMNANAKKYGKYKEDCHNSYAQRDDKYPKTLVDALTVLEQYRFTPALYRGPDRPNKQHNTDIHQTSHSFFQENNDDKPDEDTNTSSTKTNSSANSITCYNCGRKGHISANCTYTHKETGEETPREYRRRKGMTEKGKQTAAEQVDKVVATGTTCVITDDMIDTWSDHLTADDYNMCFVTTNPSNDEGIKEIIVEDLRDNNKAAINQVEGRLNPFWVLLDNQSTVHVFFNTMFLRNVRTTHKELHLFTNTGKSIINEIGELPGLGTVWVHRQGIANILSFHGVHKTKGYRITYDSDKVDAFHVYRPNGSYREFIPSKKGLYYSDFSEMFMQSKRQPPTMQMGTVLQNETVETIKTNIAKYSKQDALRAKRARTFQHIAGHLSEGQLLRIASQNQLRNCPITTRDIRIMKAMLGPSIPGLKGKTVRHSKPGIISEIVPVPAHIKEHYQDVTIAMDIMHINGIPFLTTTSRHLHYHTASALINMQTKSIVDALTALHQFYRKREFRITHILADNQFQPCSHHLATLQIDLNCVSRDEHVPEAERLNRTIKERCRCNVHMVPFPKLPKRVVIGLVKNVIFYLNAFPHPDGVSTELAPYTIVNGRVLDYNLHFSVAFGTYAQIREPTDNTMKHRTVGAIALGPSSNIQGGITFFSLVTGRELHRSKNDYTVAPMPEDAIQRLTFMAAHSPTGLVFTDRHNNPTNDDDNSIPPTQQYAHDTAHGTHTVEQHQQDQPTPNSLVLINTMGITGVNNQNTQNNTNHTNTNNNDADELNIHDDDDNDHLTDHNQDAATDDEETPAVDDHQEDTNTHETEINNTDNDEITGVGDQNETHASPALRRSTRTRNIGSYTRPMTDNYDYQYFQSNLFTDTTEERIQRISTDNEYNNYINTLEYISRVAQRDQHINDMVLTQYSLKAGLKKFGEDGRQATIKELKQMLTRNVFSEITYEDLSEEDRKLALPILLFLTLKRDGQTVKGRACADGRNQKLWTPKHESASPTIAVEALFFTLIIDAHEERDIATCDLPGHFLQTDMEGELILRLDGPLALLLAKIDKQRWKKHLRMEKGRPVIYVRCDKAIYGTVTAALLSYKKLIGHLIRWGFTMNPYEPCCWNKIINNEQMTVVFHVDDLKISHKEPKEVSAVIKLLESIYAQQDPMTICRGKIHQYLGMTLNFERKGEVRITMYDYIQRMINELPEDMIGHKTTAAPAHLFNTDQVDARKLEQKDADIFHSITAQALWMSRRGRPDLQLGTAFLCTRVKEPDEHDYKKLRHQMMYLQSTAYLPLILKADGKGTSLYIDGAHAVHADMKGHGGMYATMGKGALYASSTKSKINTLSSTETELVSVGEKLPKHLWLRQFAVEQTNDPTQIHVLYQDNKSTMLLENNGRLSCRKGSKHIHIRYFFITDRIKNKEVEVRYCPTEDMIADFFTKPLQGKPFERFRDMILGIIRANFKQYYTEYIRTIEEFGLGNNKDRLPPVPQECVENRTLTLRDEVYRIPNTNQYRATNRRQ